jgi:mono/diheme cytochrome c family protein
MASGVPYFFLTQSAGLDMIPAVLSYDTIIPLKRILIALFFLTGSFASGAQEDQMQKDANARAERLYRESCTQCHGLDAIETVRDGRAGWADTVQDMVVTGAQLDGEEMELLIDYLARRLGPGAGAMQTGQLPAHSPIPSDGTVTSGEVELPASDGKEFVQAYCHICHDAGRIVSARRSHESWERYVRSMLAQGEMELPQEEEQRLVSYLVRHFGPESEFR